MPIEPIKKTTIQMSPMLKQRLANNSTNIIAPTPVLTGAPIEERENEDRFEKKLAI